MDRATRALCRILRAHGKTHQDIANVVGQSTAIVAKAIVNDYAQPDDAGTDYDFVDAQTKKEYPPKVSSRPFHKCICAKCLITALNLSRPIERVFETKGSVRGVQRNNRNESQ
jgi:hypothetical protein